MSAKSENDNVMYLKTYHTYNLFIKVMCIFQENLKEFMTSVYLLARSFVPALISAYLLRKFRNYSMVLKIYYQVPCCKWHTHRLLIVCAAKRKFYHSQIVNEHSIN